MKLVAKMSVFVPVVFVLLAAVASTGRSANV